MYNIINLLRDKYVKGDVQSKVKYSNLEYQTSIREEP
jgi:hypothetical protein